MTSSKQIIPRLMQALALGIPAFCFAGAALAETGQSDEPEQGSGIDADENEAQAKAKDGTDGSAWRLEPGLRLTMRGITARTTAPGEDEVIDGNAIALVAAPSLMLTRDDVTVTLRNATTRLEFEDPGRADRWQNAARLSVNYDLSDATRVTAFGERSDNILAAEFTSTDEWEFGGELMHSLDAANRVQIGASWRERSYDDAAGSKGDGIRVDGEYRYRFGANHFAFLRGRYDEINSAEARRDLSRWLAEASYQRPLAADLRLRGELSYQKLDFTGRPVAGGGTRQDDLFWPELTLIWSPGAWRIAGEARYIVRNSTDPAFDRSGYRFEVEVSHAF
ncbi:hypothetical protein [Porphyrobacter sp. ULC335]|uniref:hypothetical protein n=1 Tax=Porphyrobacter sp. ULC335 TaxID=2854260 RepID=UPI00221EC60B|nr:hypothetical protein [Porphyrobacter sp. ULC335]UYV14387.1 hypothetical protein KVF90_09350 [Porphyrobacter sp. ULC335]